ncbi:MAG: hypothetical protein RugAbin2_01534 [Rugosibacter sp.]|jgi:hypothetical protein|nr:hypothetical protein [Rugosibacter sp.]
MELKKYIELGVQKTETLKALADVLGQMPEALTAAKGGRRGLPLLACVRLAYLVNADPLNVIVASQMVTETDEEKRKEWKPFLTSDWRRGWDSNPR